ncbi:hypothetical protein STEG23_016862, partial [Scotinomys teguina]
METVQCAEEGRLPEPQRLLELGLMLGCGFLHLLPSVIDLITGQAHVCLQRLLQPSITQAVGEIDVSHVQMQMKKLASRKMGREPDIEKHSEQTRKCESVVKNFRTKKHRNQFTGISLYYRRQETHEMSFCANSTNMSTVLTNMYQYDKISKYHSTLKNAEDLHPTISTIWGRNLSLLLINEFCCEGDPPSLLHITECGQ